MTDAAPAKPALPDRLSIDPKSPHFNRDVLQFQIGIRFNGVEKHNVEEILRVGRLGARAHRQQIQGPLWQPDDGEDQGRGGAVLRGVRTVLPTGRAFGG